MAKLTKEEIEKRKKRAENKVKYYSEKLSKIEENEKRIGFKFY